MPDPQPRKKRINIRTVPLIVATALLMENLDSSVLSTSLPPIALDLGASPIHLKLALTSYLLALAIFIPASGWMADHFGARKVFRWAIVVFTAGSIACGLSSSLAELVASRVLQGIGGSMMVPVARLIVLRSTPKSGFVSAMAWLTVPALIGPVLGPPLGGFITTYFHWRWIFWINVPIALLGIVLTSLFIPRVAPDAPRGFDLRGFMLAGPGLAAFLTGLTLAGLGIASPALIVAMTLGGAALVALYIRHALIVKEPLVDLRLLALPTFRVSAAAGTLFRIGSGAMPFLLPLLYQVGFGLTAFQSGTMTFVSGIGAILMKFIAQPILHRFGFRRVLAVNAVISALFMLAPATFSAETPWLWMLALLFAGGVCRSLQFTAINAISYSEIDSHRMSSATSFNAVLQQLTGSIGITLAAFGIEAMAAYTGGADIEAGYFAPVFVMVAVFAAASGLGFARLAKDSGAELLGRGKDGQLAERTAI